MKNGLLIVLSGPSGVGKKTVGTPLMEQKDLHLAFSVSMTTRAKRFDEVEGKDYFFVTRQRFEQAIKNHEMLEGAQYVNNYYGTPKSYVEKLREQGKNVLLEIESNGALQIMDFAKNMQDRRVITIIIVPPSLTSLEKRLHSRSTETPEICAARINQAEWELSLKDKYQYSIINDDLERARNELRDILKKEIEKNVQ